MHIDKVHMHVVSVVLEFREKHIFVMSIPGAVQDPQGIYRLTESLRLKKPLKVTMSNH